MYYKKRKNRMIGFYVAMGVCLLAVGIAAAASYSSVEKKTSEVSSADEEAVSVPVTTANEPENHSEKEEQKAEKKVEKKAQTAINHIDITASDDTSSSETPKPTSSEDEDIPLPEKLSEETSGDDIEDIISTWASRLSFAMPVGGTVIKEFSDRELMYSETMRDYRIHNGIDISASRGDTVHAITDGTVMEVKFNDLLGNMVVIDHNGFLTSYCGLGSTALVKPGEAVKAGQDIGSVLEVPSEVIEQAHIHIEVKQNDAYIDPLSVLG